MEKANKRKAKAVALATAAVLVLAGTIAYLADASGTIRNVFDNEHIRVQINESGITDSTTGANTDNGDKDYTVLPGTSEGKDPTITVDTDTDAYVFAVVKDTINSHKATPESTGATKFVNYTIADGWVELDKANLAKKENVKKYVDILNNKTDGNLTVDPGDPNTRIYYRKVHGAESDDHSGADHRFTYNLLTNDQISYPTTLTNEDMNLLNGISDEEKKALIFQTWAIQMKPFCPDDEIAETDLTKADQKQYAKDAWNETKVVPTAVTVSQAESKTEVGVGKTLPLTATVTPKNAVDKTVTWSSSDTTKATVDANGVVTGVAAGEVTITAAANGASGVSGTYAVTVKAPSVSYAVQLYSIDGLDTPDDTSDDVANFGPAVSNVTETSVQHADGHTCIHNATWAEIKEDPAAFSDCIDAGCTKSIELDTTKGDIWSENAATMTTTGDGVGVLHDELNTNARAWNFDASRTFSGKYAESNIKTTLDSLLNAFPSDLQDAISEKTITYKAERTSYTMDAKLYLLSLSEHKDGTVAYARGNGGTGAADTWWARDCFYFSNLSSWAADCVNRYGRTGIGFADGSDLYGVALGFSISKSN